MNKTENKFKVGDKILALKELPKTYLITCKDAVMQVTKVYDSNRIEVKVIKPFTGGVKSDCRFKVDSCYFTFLGKCCSKCGQVLPLPPVKVGEYTVEFMESGNHIKVGCTTVEKETVRMIAERMGLL